MTTVEISDQLYRQIEQVAQGEGLSVEHWLNQYLAQINTPQSEHPSHRLFARMADTVPYMLYIYDRKQQKNTFVNRYAEVFFGLSLDEIRTIGQQVVIDALHPDDIEQLERFRDQWEGAPDEVVFENEYRMRRADGKYRWIRSYEAVLERNPDGTPHLIVGTAIDITDYKTTEQALRDAQERFAKAFHNHPAPMSIFNTRTGKRFDVNDSYLQFAGKTRETMLSENVFDNITTSDLEYLVQNLETHGLVRDYPMVMNTTDGKRHVRASAALLDTAEKDMALAVVIDVTAQVEAEQQQQRLIEQLEMTIKTAGLGVWQLDLATNQLTWNAQQYALFGISPEALAQDKDAWRSCVHPDDLEIMKQNLQQIYDNGVAYGLRYRIIRPDGELRYIDASGRAIYDEAGEVVRLIGINWDITDFEVARRALAESEARYRAIFQKSLNAVGIFDADGQIVMLNAEGARILGTSQAEAVGKTLVDFVPVRHKLVKANIQQALESGQAVYDERMVQLPDGRERWYWAVFTPLPDVIDGEAHVQVIAYDITSRKQAEQLRRERAELESALTRQHALAEQRSQMLYVLAHELRTPLAIMLTASDILTRYGDRLTEAQREEKLKRIIGQIHHLTGLLDNLSQLAGLDERFLTYTPEATDISAVCLQAIDTVRDEYGHTHRLSLVMQGRDSTGTMDSSLIRHALVNLLSNAIKFSPIESEVVVTVEQTATEWQFQVVDHGIGIPEVDYQVIFLPFKRASNVGEIRGVGLGLSIVKEIAERHGGRVKVESTVDAGSTLTMTIPMMPGT